MRFRFFHFSALITLGAALAGLAPSSTRAADAPEGKEGLSITNSPRRGRKSLQQLEEDLAKSLQSFSPKNSLDGMMAPAQPVPRPAAAAPARRTKDDGLKNDWKQDLESLNRELSGEDAFKLQDDRPGRKKQRWGNTRMDDSYGSRSGSSAEGSLFGEEGRTGKKKTAGSASDTEEDLKLPNGIRDSEQRLRSALGDAPAGNFGFGGTFLRNGMSDPFALGNRGPSAADLEAHRSYMQEYQNLLRQPAITPSFNAPQVTDSRQPATQVLSPLSTGGYAPAARPSEATPGNVNSFLTPQRVPDVNATVLNQWNPLYTPPHVDPPKRVAPTTPVTEYQRRKF